jgi:hypothetical protein
MLSNIINQYNSTSSVFGIHSSLFFQPKLDDAFRTRRFGQLLELPLGSCWSSYATFAAITGLRIRFIVISINLASIHFTWVV